MCFWGTFFWAATVADSGSDHGKSTSEFEIQIVFMPPPWVLGSFYAIVVVME